MARLGSFIGGFLVGGVAVYTGLKYHVVRANDGFHLIPKLQAQFDEAYVDIRQFGLNDWNQHRALAVAMTQSNKGYLMQETVSDQLRQSIDGVLQGLGGTYRATPTPPPQPEPQRDPWGGFPRLRRGS